MKNKFDDLVLAYLSINNESREYREIRDEYEPDIESIHSHQNEEQEFPVLHFDDIYKIKADARENEDSPEICPECEGDMYGGKCVTCDSDKNHEDNESEYGEEKDYYNDISHMHEPEDEYLEPDRLLDMRAAADYGAESPNSEHCPECDNKGVVDRKGRCHYCDPDDEEPVAGKEY